MHINNLPEDILIIILKYACHSGEYNVNEWKKSLPLLAMCRLWRSAAMPSLFCSVIMKYSNYRGLYKRYGEGECIDEPIDEIITTNADIIAAAGRINLVKHVDITIFFIADPLPGLLAAYNYLADLSKKWPSVKSLEIQLKYRATVPSLSSREMTKYDNAMPSAVSNFTLLLPSIVDIKSRRYSNNYVTSILYNQLLAAYSGQTTRLVINQSLSLNKSFVFNKITHLKINVDVEEANQLPVILADTLVSLSLQCIPYTYNWSTFAIESEPKDIEFSSLTSLEVKYNVDPRNMAAIRSDMHNRPQMSMLRFPKLKYIKLFNNNKVIPLFEYSVLPKELECFNVGGSIKAIAELEKYPIPKLKHISMSVSYEDSDSHIDPFTVINQVASKAQCTTDVEMLVNGYLRKEMLSNILCPALTRLTVTTLIDGDTIPRLLQGLPNLTHMVLSRIINVDKQTCSIVAEYEKHKFNNAQTLNSSIENLELRFMNGNVSIPAATTLVKNLLPRLPALSKLCASRITLVDIKEFVNEYKNYYPHLDTINISLSQ